MPKIYTEADLRVRAQGALHDADRYMNDGNYGPALQAADRLVANLAKLEELKAARSDMRLKA